MNDDNNDDLNQHDDSPYYRPPESDEYPVEIPVTYNGEEITRLVADEPLAFEHPDSIEINRKTP